MSRFMLDTDFISKDLARANYKRHCEKQFGESILE